MVMCRKISVAMCTYNGAKFIKEQLQSILNQELCVNEIVVCDDGSNDGTIDIVKQVVLMHPEICWIIQQNISNLGVTKNFEKAISLCTGDYIFLSDQDDIWHRDKTKVIIDFFDENPGCDVVFTDANLVGKDGALISKYTLLDSFLLKPYFYLWEKGFKFEILNIWNVATGATMALRRSFVDNLFIKDDKYYLHDYQIVIDACKTNSIGVILECLMDYRQHGDNVVGISKKWWIYKENPVPPSLLKMIVEPHAVRESFEGVDDRVSFYETRYKNYSSVKGKVLLFFSVLTYIKFYKDIWTIFYYSDLLYGVNRKLREWYVNWKDYKINKSRTVLL